MSTREDVMSAVKSTLSLQLEGSPQPEGHALRQEVTTEDGKAGLLYAFDSEDLSMRLVVAHELARDGQVSAVPALLQSGPRWALVERPAGIPLRDWLATRPHQTGLADIIHDAGVLLRKLHSIASQGVFGDLLEATEGTGQWLTFNGYVAAGLEVFSERVRVRGFSEETQIEIMRSISDLRYELASFHPRTPAYLNHGRPSFEHFWVDPVSLDLVGLTGFQRASFLPPEADIVFLIHLGGLNADEELVRTFYRGYGAARTMDVQRRERFYARFLALEAIFEKRGPVENSIGSLVELTG